MHIPIEHDFIGIGFGPSNLAIAVAIEEQTRFGGAGINHCYIEKKPAFVWHGSMLLEGSDMQISFLKDLATLRDPTSKFTFINYLHEKGRLRDFINLKSFFPSRIEYNDYLRWAASHFDHRCRYSEEVVDVEPVKEGAKVALLRVHSLDANGHTHTRLTRNLVFGIGGVPNIPAEFDSVCRQQNRQNKERVFHAAHYLEKMASMVQTNGVPRRIAVIGGGQSGAEIFMDLISRFGDAEVTLIIRGEALMPSDDSPFVNEIFSPQFTDQIYQQPEAQRRATLERFRSTNYSVVDLDLIEKIYMLLYQQQVSGVQRHALLAAKVVTAAHARSDRIELALRDTNDDGNGNGNGETHSFDAVVLATGYRRDDHKRLLGGIADYIDGYEVERDYRLRTTPDFLPKIYLQGCCEDSHGLSDTLLSVLAVRSVEIVESLLHEHSQHAKNSSHAASCCAIENHHPSFHVAV